MATIDDFQNLDIRAGKIIEVEDFPEALKPLYKITIDFGKEIGIKKSAVGATHLYKKSDLEGKIILGIVNLAPRRVGTFVSEVLTLGVSDEENRCILIAPDKKVYLGAKLY